mmetsp:Transcript_549/g.1496  ORF Transcript_549/g.1496 Transcript_549/m.1496 type:complete len:278 (+) Transcript_549:73-906(+)
MFRIFGKSDAGSSCNCGAGDEKKTQETLGPEPQRYLAYKEPAFGGSRPRLQEAAMTVARQSDEAIFEVVEASDVAEEAVGSVCQVSVVVKESSAFVRVAAGVASVVLVLLSSLGALMTMAERDLTVEVALSPWVWLVFAWIYAAVICLSERRGQCPNSSESYQAGIFQAVPALATQAGRSCFHFAVAFQCLLFRPLYLSIPCCLTICGTGCLLLMDARFPCSGRATSSEERAKESRGVGGAGGGGRMQSQKPSPFKLQVSRAASHFIPRLPIAHGAP